MKLKISYICADQEIKIFIFLLILLSATQICFLQWVSGYEVKGAIYELILSLGISTETEAWY